MHVVEAKWIKSVLKDYSKDELSPVLNIGSSTGQFRTVNQPHIDEHIFAPLRERGIEIIHQDIKDAPGVDVVGDLADPQFIEKLKSLHFKCIVCTNLLEHLPDPLGFIEILDNLAGSEAHLVMTGPCVYNRHLDPIDNMYRPTAREVSERFSSVEVLESKEISVGTVLSSYRDKPHELIRLVCRCAVPFIKPVGWITSINRLAWLLRDRTVYAVLMRKNKSADSGVVVTPTLDSSAETIESAPLI